MTRRDPVTQDLTEMQYEAPELVAINVMGTQYPAPRLVAPVTLNRRLARNMLNTTAPHL